MCTFKYLLSLCIIHALHCYHTYFHIPFITISDFEKNVFINISQSPDKTNKQNNEIEVTTTYQKLKWENTFGKIARNVKE